MTSPRIALALAACALCVGALASACRSSLPPSSSSVAPASSMVPRGETLDFSFQAIDHSVVSSASLRGRNTVIVFVTSYDIASNAQVRFLNGLSKSFAPRINCVAVVLEPKESEILVAAFADALDLRFPIVHLEPRALAGGAFKSVEMVPHVVVLDRQGRVVLHKHGLMDEKQLAALLSQLDS